MSTIAATRVWLRRLAAAAPSAWHYDPVFRWSAIGAGVALALFILRPHDPATSRPNSIGTALVRAGQPGADAMTLLAAGTPPAPPLPPALPNDRPRPIAGR